MEAVFSYLLGMTAFSVRPGLHVLNDEILFVELLLPRTKPIIVDTVYRPPKQRDFLEHFEVFFKLLL